METIDELKGKLAKPESLFPNPEQNFLDFAKNLMCNFQIKKGDKRYWMTDIEFYIYTDSHRDIITYPRNCEAGRWFFHASGVDISFESKVRIEPHPKTQKQMPYLDKTAVFGGILIRGIVLDSESDNPISGPMNVCDALFDQFNAFDAPDNFPQIKEASIPRNVQVLCDEKGRYGLNKDPEKKVKSILYNYSGIDEPFITKPELVAAYGEYFDAKYHFLAVPTA